MNRNRRRNVQLCRNGHLVNFDPHGNPDNNRNFCSTCGEATLTKCEKCQNPIEDTSYMIFKAPSFCGDCGSPFPWTATRLEAAHELAKTFEYIDEDQRKILDSNIDVLVKDTPSTSIAASKVKTVLRKAGDTATQMFRDILVDIMSETAKKIIFP